MNKISQLIICLTVMLISNLNAQQWKPQVSGTTSHLLSLSFPVDKNVGYVAGYNGVILKTQDGGGLWQPQNSGTSFDLYEIHFMTADRGLAVGTGNTLLLTTNGGSKWNQVSVPLTDDAYYYRNIEFVDDKIGFISGGIGGEGGVILKTINGGSSWSELNTNSPSGAIYGMCFLNANVGYYGNFAGEIRKTIDGGNTWTLLNSGVSKPIYAIDFTDADTGYACGEGGIILKTEDSGNSWTPLNTNTTDNFSDLVFIDEYVGFAIGGNVNTNQSKIMKTKDKGATWTTESTSTSRQFGSEFLSFNAGYSCGLDGTILKITDITASDKKIENGNFGIKVFPNPTSEVLHIDLTNTIFKERSDISITNSLGLVVYNRKSSSEKFNINLKELGGNGIFYVIITDPSITNAQEIKKVIVF